MLYCAPMFRNLCNMRANEPSCYQKPCSMRATEPSCYFFRLARKEESRNSVGWESEKKLKAKQLGGSTGLLEYIIY